MQAAVSRAAISDLRDQALTASDALRLALRRVPRLIGLDIQVTLIFLIAVCVLVMAGIGAPLLLIPLIPAFIVGSVYALVVASLAYVVASVGPTTPSLRYGARLVRGRFWRTLGRMLLCLGGADGRQFRGSGSCSRSPGPRRRYSRWCRSWCRLWSGR